MQSQDNDKTVVGGLALNFLYSITSSEGKQYFIEDKINVGRGTDSDVMINDKKISRNHATLTVIDGRLQVTDNNSSNGSFVNGKKIASPSNIINGDLLAFEKHVYTVKIEINEEESEQEEVEDENEHTSIVDMSEEYFNKLNNAVENLEEPVKEDKPAPDKIEVEKVEESKIAQEPKIENPVKAEEPKIEKKQVAVNTMDEPSNQEDKEDIPSSWIEDSTPVDGTRMMDVSELNALRSSTNKEVRSNETTVSRLHCFMEGQDEEVIELAIADFDQASGWEIGRDPQCDIVLEHPSVSNRHAQIVHQSGRWKMVNLVSTNGIVINGQKKLTSYLSDGDKIGLGSVDLIFKASKSSAKKVKKSDTQVTKSTSNIPVIPILLGLILLVLAVLIYFYLQQ